MLFQVVDRFTNPAVYHPVLFALGSEKEHRSKLRGRIGRWRHEGESSDEDNDVVDEAGEDDESVS